MSIIGFVLSSLLMLYLTAAVVIGIPLLSVWGVWLKGFRLVIWILTIVLIIYIWVLLFQHSPFSITVNP